MTSTHVTDWFKEARWGVLTHFLADTASAKGLPDLSATEWNRRVDAFDVEGLAAQLEEVGAGYYVLTIGQNSGFYCSPNSTYDKLIGIKPSKLSTRDLISDLADALAKRGIRTMTYLPSGAPDNDKIAVEKLKWAKGSERLSEFQVMWQDIIREWSTRWGSKISGWWIDGVYYADAMYRHEEEPNFQSLLAALKAGNPDSLVALNPGVLRTGAKTMAGSGEDYIAGEIDFGLPVQGRWYDGSSALPHRFVDGAQLHYLSFLGNWWGQGPLRFPDELVLGYTKHINAQEGVVTWDVPVDDNGHIPGDFLTQLKLLKSLSARTR